MSVGTATPASLQGEIQRRRKNKQKKVTRAQLKLITTIAPCFEMIIFLGNFSPLHEKEEGRSGEL